jgi:hypothetical protein
MQRFDLRKLNDAEVKEQYQVKITNRFAALENFDDNMNMNTGWENIRENIKTSAKESLGHYEFQQHKPWFDDECSKLIDKRKQAKLQWLQNPSQVNGDNMDCAVCTIFFVRTRLTGHAHPPFLLPPPLSYLLRCLGLLF